VCGIAGCYQQQDGALIAASMSDTLSHRGPDASGSYQFSDESVSVQFAHRRLSIIDLSTASNQPFVKGHLALSYNGELYNYRELRRELEAHRVSFHTESDTEVVLEAWRLWGADALRRFRGMFAFAIFDQQTGRLVLARDHLGIKPLFYLERGRGVVFASELKAITTALGPELSVDHEAMVAAMLYYWVPESHCAIRGVSKLAPGTWREFRAAGDVRARSYWRLPDAAAEAAAGPPVDLREVIEAGVQAHLVADVPVSTFLSGGLDSSIVAVLAKRSNPDIDAYTIRFRDADTRLEAMPNDAFYARKVANQFGIDLHEIEISPQITALLPEMVRTLDEPIGDPAAVNTFLICQEARNAGVKVMLSGMGADELFGGYRKHLACVLATRYQALPASVRTALVSPLVDRLPVAVGGRGLRSVRWAKRFLSFADLPEEIGFRRSYTLYGNDELCDILDPAMSGSVQSIFEEHARIYNDNTLSDHVSRMCLADARLFLPGLNLAYTDRASMAASTEVRVPFVDVEVVRAAFSLPGNEKIAGRTTKAALKAAAAAWLPNEIIHRPKGLFSAPLRAWVRRDLRTEVDEILLKGDLIGSGFLRKVPVQQLVDEDRSGREDRSKQIWQLLTLELWLEQTRRLGVAA
jgi:asparagine synthase (glutamine-hydrolysing)